jgi:hypothetical protein
MKVLVACEYSGRVRDAFIAKGHDAMSCDLLPTDAIGPHYQGDVYDMLSQDWDLIIAHPPCTALTVAGNSTYGEGQPKYAERLNAVEWTVNLWNAMKAASPRVCMENPVGVLRRLGGMHSPQFVQPYQFGHMEQKKTGLFLHGLLPLVETNNVFEAMITCRHLLIDGKSAVQLIKELQTQWRSSGVQDNGLSRQIQKQA